MTAKRLSRAKIVEAALELADAQGSESLSMRALARNLGVDPMAVYRHFANKAELLGAMCDATVEQLTPLDPAGDWEPQLRRLLTELRGALVARPSLVPVMLTAPATPAATEAARQAIALLVSAGLAEEEAAAAFGAVFAYAMGAIATEIAVPPTTSDTSGLREATAALDPDGDHRYLDRAIELMQGSEFVDAGVDLLIAGIRASVR